MNGVGETWWQIEIEDDSALSGSATAHLLSLVANEGGLRYVVANSVEGSGPRLTEIQAFAGSVTPIEELLPEVEAMAQVDWGDFFLANNAIDASRIRAGEKYSESLRKCGALVRAVDDTYFYVYGRQPALRVALERSFPGSRCKSGEPEQLDYPE